MKLDAAQHIEHLAAEGLSLGLKLAEQPLEHIALARLACHKVPQVAHLRLADAVDAAKALLKAVGIPGQVVVHHEVGTLQVHALASCVGGHHDVHVWVLPELVLGASALIAAHATAYLHDCL